MVIWQLGEFGRAFSCDFFKNLSTPKISTIAEMEGLLANPCDGLFYRGSNHFLRGMDALLAIVDPVKCGIACHRKTRY